MRREIILESSTINTRLTVTPERITVKIIERDNHDPVLKVILEHAKTIFPQTSLRGSYIGGRVKLFDNNSKFVCEITKDGVTYAVHS